jgi:hypothetical protein
VRRRVRERLEVEVHLGSRLRLGFLMAVGILLLVVVGKICRGSSNGKMKCKGSSSARTIHKVFSHAKTLVVLSSDHLPIRISETIVEGGGTKIRFSRPRIWWWFCEFDQGSFDGNRNMYNRGNYPYRRPYRQ